MQKLNRLDASPGGFCYVWACEHDKGGLQALPKTLPTLNNPLHLYYKIVVYAVYFRAAPDGAQRRRKNLERLDASPGGFCYV